MTFNSTQRSQAAKIQALADELSNPNNAQRHAASAELYALGDAIVPQLLLLIKFSPSKDARKEAVKLLGKIKDPATIEVLVNALRDENYEVRWDAAESLVQFGSAGLPTLLQHLVQHFESRSLREGAKHILRSLRGKDSLDDPLEQLYQILDTSPMEKIPWVAQDALDKLHTP